MPTSTATQSPEGRWLLKVRHDIDRPTLKIPVVLVYEGHSAIDDDDTPIQVTKSYPLEPVVTQWKTPLGQAIDTSKITIKKPLPQVIDGYNIYQVTGITWDSVEPYTAETYSLILSVTPPDLPWDGECQITSIYRKTVDMTGITDTNVTTGTVFSIKDDDGTVSIVSRDGNSYVKANTGKTSTLTKTKSVTIIGKYANEIEGETIVEVQTKTESGVPEDPEEGGGSTTGDTPTVAPEATDIVMWETPLKIGFFYDIDSFKVKVMPDDLSKEQKKPLLDIADKNFIHPEWFPKLSWHSENGGFYEAQVSHPIKTGITTISAITRDGKLWKATTLEAVKEGVYVTSVDPISVEIENKSNSLLGLSESEEITVNFKFENGRRKKVKISDPERMKAQVSIDANSWDLMLLKKTQRNRSYADGDIEYLPFIIGNGGSVDGTAVDFPSLVKDSLTFTSDSEGYVTGGSFKVKIIARQNLGAERSYDVHILGRDNDDKGKAVRVTQPASDKVYEVPAVKGCCDKDGVFYTTFASGAKYDVSNGGKIDGANVGVFNIICPKGTYDPSNTDKTKISESWLSIVKTSDTDVKESNAPKGSQRTAVYIKAEPNNTGADRTATITFNANILSAEGGSTVLNIKQLA